MKLDIEATKKAGQKVYFSPFKSQSKSEKVEKKTKKVEVEEPKENEVLGYRDEE